MLDTSGSSDVAVAAEDDQRRKAVLPCLLRIRQTKVNRMLGREKRDDVIAGDVTSQVGDKVPKIVFLLSANRTVREKDAHVTSREAADRVVHVDPCIHALAGTKLGTRRTQLRRDDRAAGIQSRRE
jgi:hypothetical protein